MLTLRVIYELLTLAGVSLMRVLDHLYVDYLDRREVEGDSGEEIGCLRGLCPLILYYRRRRGP